MFNKLPSTLVLLTLLVAACLPQTVPEADSAPRELTVLAAASLAESFGELGALFEAENPSVKVTFNFAGSQQLAQQLDQGAPADVFASASQKYMDAVIASGRVNQDQDAIFVTNRLVVIFPKENPAGLYELRDLARPGLKLNLADRAVPVGQYSFDFIEKASQDEQFGASFKEDVLKNVVSYENNVKAVVTKVVLGEADAGIVYVSDVTVDVAGELGSLVIPDAFNTVAEYSIAPVAAGQNSELARAFIELILSTEGQQMLARYGFIPVKR